MRFGIFGLFSIFVGFAGCATTPTETIADRTVTRDYQFNGFRWDDGGVLAVLFKAIERDRKVSLCGAYTTNSRDGVGGTTFNELALQAMSITIDDKVIVKDLTFFRRLPFPGDGVRPDGQASCLLADIPWQPKYGNSIRPKLVKGKTNFLIAN